jgi:hypothetical protein
MRFPVLMVMLTVLLFASSCSKGVPASFAQCLTDNGVMMYGAYWCPHCQSQKEMFGKTWELVNYVECSLPERAGQTQICKDDDIRGYPTWQFGDGTRIEGEATLTQLSEKSGCVL